MIHGIASENVSQSVQEAPGLFSRLKYRIGDQYFSADDMEHGVLRGNARPWFHITNQWRPGDPRKAWSLKPVDPRVHFALVCGSRSCAPINYYDAASIYEQLEIASRRFVNSSEVIVLPEEGKIMLSEIFKWYASDFGDKRGVLDFLYDYLADDKARKSIRDKAEKIRFEYIYYDWNLNR